MKGAIPWPAMACFHVLRTVLSIINFQLVLLYNIHVVLPIPCSWPWRAWDTMFICNSLANQPRELCENARVVKQPLPPSPVVAGDFHSLCILYASQHTSFLNWVCHFCAGMGQAIKSQQGACHIKRLMWKWPGCGLGLETSFPPGTRQYPCKEAHCKTEHHPVSAVFNAGLL